MGYIYLCIALLAGCTKGFMGKKISGRIETQKQSVLVNFIRALICIFIGLAFVLPETIRGKLIIDFEAVIFGTLAGVTLSVFLVSWMLAVKHGALTLLSVAQMFGVVVTLVCSFICFKDPISLRQLIAIAILFVAVLIMFSYNNNLKGGLSVGGFLAIAVCGVFNGFYDFAGKLYMSFSSSGASVLTLTTYVIAAVTLGIVFLIENKGEKKKSETTNKELLRQSIIPIIVMSVCLFLNSYFKALANLYLPPVVLFPASQAGGLIFSAAMSAIFFKEKITVRCVIGLALAFVAIILLK